MFGHFAAYIESDFVENMKNSSTNSDKFSRRKVLKGLSVASAAVAAPMILPGRVLGKDGGTAPSERIAIGLIGCGKIMDGHCKSHVGHSAVQVRAVSDVKTQQRDLFQERVNGAYAKSTGQADYTDCEAYNNFDEMLQRDDIDAVVVGTPDHWHAHATIAAMRAGKDVYCEKPLTLTIQEGQRIRDVSKETGQIVQTGSQQRSDQYFRRASELVRNGYAGDITEIHTRLGSFPAVPELGEEPVPDGFDYDRWLGQAPADPYHPKRVEGNYGGGWRCFWEYGARKNGDWGAHHYDIIQWALGTDDSGPATFTPKGYDGAPYQLYEYGNGIKVYRDSDKCPQMINFYGSEGSVHVGRGSKFETKPEALRGQAFKDTDVRLYVSKNHREDWLNCIRSREQPICNASVGHRTATVCHLNGIAERTGDIVRWDPEKEQLIDPTEAVLKDYNRPRREGYELPA